MNLNIAEIVKKLCKKELTFLYGYCYEEGHNLSGITLHCYGWPVGEIRNINEQLTKLGYSDYIRAVKENRDDTKFITIKVINIDDSFLGLLRIKGYINDQHL